MSTPFSPARRLVQIVWDHKQEATSHSWQRVNAAMQSAVMLAIDGGLAFAKGDFDHFAKTMRMHYWIGENGIESCYSRAVGYGNITACRAVEAFLGREPFLFNGVRIHVGHRFDWEGETVTCTSFPDKETVIACSYHDGLRGKVKRRHTITLAEVKAGARAGRAERKAAKEAKEKLQREAEARQKAEAEAARKRHEEQQRRSAQERITRIVAVAPSVLTRTTTVEEAVEVGLCREGVVKFCALYLEGRQAATLQEAIDAAAEGAAPHYLDSIEILVSRLYLKDGLTGAEAHS